MLTAFVITVAVIALYIPFSLFVSYIFGEIIKRSNEDG